MIHWLKRHFRLAGILAAAALLVAVAAALLPDITEGESAMSTTHSTPQAAMPPSDGLATAVAETATFALG